MLDNIMIREVNSFNAKIGLKRVCFVDRKGQGGWIASNGEGAFDLLLRTCVATAL